MFDMSPQLSASDDVVFDMETMVGLLQSLSDADLAKIEDDIDFYHFTGCASAQLKDLFAAAAALKAAA